MTEPLSLEAQGEVLAGITERLVFDLPAGWSHLQLVYAAVGEYVAFSGLLRMENGGLYGWVPPDDDVKERFAALRAGMARPDRGTWFQATLRLDYPDQYSVDYNRTDLPDFGTPPPAEAYARELELFPRAEEHTPAWLRDGASSGS
ncbi:hypothetical protein AB0A74_31425 [Saccharothrix sp. NPDC042600]|uniref:hypothetical protein n=1 Tax=Saccharothrix sp. NPDC042600 TaxID=3154492 RepID=UPI0033C607C1|nr:hypothetical protein GCM10017745_57930 [Saccharothrix mutabilis subsp. capreolus]